MFSCSNFKTLSNTTFDLQIHGEIHPLDQSMHMWGNYYKQSHESNDEQEDDRGRINKINDFTPGILGDRLM